MVQSVTRVPLVVARTEFRRTLRVVAGDRTKVLMLAAVALLALGPMTAVGTWGLSVAGERVAAGSVDVFGVTIPEILTGVSALVWLGLTLMATLRTTTAVADLDEPACLLLSTSLPNVVVGLIGAEVVRFTSWLLVPVLVLSGAFAYGAGTALPVIFALVLFALVVPSALSVGFVLGIWIRHLITVYEPIARYRTPLFVLVGIVYFGAIATGRFETVTVVLFETLGDSPLGWPGHILLLGIPNVSPTTIPLVGAFVGTAAVTVLAVALGVASARIHWYADPARTDDDDDAAAERSSDRLGNLLSYGLERPVRTVTVTAIRRTKRAPVRLLYVAYPLFGAFYIVQDIVQTGTISSFVAVVCCLYVVWGSGVVFTLNPLGDLGRALPAVLTSTVSGRRATTGLVAAGALVAAPIAIVVSLVVGVASPLSLRDTGFLLVGTVLGTIAAPALATGVGTVFPRFGSVKVTNNREAVMPSKTAFAVYTAAIAVPVVAAAVLYADASEPLAAVATAILSLAPWFDLTVPATLFARLSWIALPVGLLAPIVSALYAAERFDRYRLE
ncbi:hypothetical protein OB955_10500 [Halobacteria archaeon AArc-m2/3/4]|uniref:Uncharacterized protein n=1 Tax=Natronoglomus mannanivorans TaxID=2979990 RepID=A0AAP3E0J9_9EURY|nr:hypothetical protein [Halobacteria archaeon AArc-xg1-1]MCU4973172.1 hypothetical protein [Halobacteria archaeon AArc-m2/3/4]